MLDSALSPTHPFPQDAPRLKLAGIVTGLLAISLLTTSAMFIKMNTFFAGFGFFGDPLIWRGLDWLNRTYPNWQKLLELRKYVHKPLGNFMLNFSAPYLRAFLPMLS